MSKTRNPDALIRIGDAINVLCCKKCYPGLFCPDSYCVEMWDKFEDVERIDAVPVKHGRWIDIDSEMYTWKIRCSNCGHERSMMSTGQIYPMYCENCGARMDGKNGSHEKAD